MKRILIILIVILIATGLSADTLKDTLTVSVLAQPEEYPHVGFTVSEPSIDDLPTEIGSPITLGKTTNDSGELIAIRKLYLFYYYVGRNDVKLQIECTSPLTRTVNGTVETIDYAISFGTGIPEDYYWDGGEFSKGSSSDTSIRIYSSSTSGAKNTTASLKKNTTNQKVMARGIWPVTIYTSSIVGKTISQDVKYEGAITLTVIYG